MTQASQPHPTSPFVFEIEFTPDGEVLRGPNQKYFSREEADQLAARARMEGEASARQAGFQSVDRMVAHLTPVAAQLSAIAEQLRAEAAELAMIAACKIAGDALDRNGQEQAARAIAEVVRQLKAKPVIDVSLAPEALPEVQRRLEQLHRQGAGSNMTFTADAHARPGDWRVTWNEGSTGFSRASIEAAIDAIIKARLQDPLTSQPDLFSAA